MTDGERRERSDGHIEGRIVSEASDRDAPGAVPAGCSTLEALFDRWKRAHEVEPEESTQATFPKNGRISPAYEDFKSSFCRDGYLNKQQPVSVLFLCRESNVAGTAEAEDYFWFRTVFAVKTARSGPKYTEKTRELSDPKKRGAARRAETKYYNCLCRLKEILCDSRDLSDCAYMNINKRGGYSSCDPGRLLAYAKQYRNFILSEIKLLAPKKIVICGDWNSRALRSLMEEIFQECRIPRYWMYPHHPSAYTNKLIDQFETSPPIELS